MSNISNALNLLQNNIPMLSVPEVTSSTSSGTTRVVQVSLETQRAERGEKRPAFLMSQSATRESIQSDSKRQSVHDLGVNALLSTTLDNSNTGSIPPHSADNGITALMKAVEEGQEEMVKVFMSSANINAHDATGQTALTFAVLKGHTAIVELLLNAGARTDVYIQGVEYTIQITPLILAARHGHKDILKLLLNNGADQGIAFYYAIVRGDVEIVNLLIDAGASREVRNRQKRTLLMLAVAQGQKEIVEFLLEKGVDKEARDSEGLTALYHAIRHGDTEIVKLLIDAGASREVRDRQKRTLLMLAVAQGQKEIVEFLLEKGVDKEARDSKECTALYHATFRGYTEIAELLISAGASLQVQDRQGCTLLIRAAGRGKKDIITLLLKKNVDKEACDRLNATALHYAVCYGYVEIVELLISASANINARNFSGGTPLAIAVSRGDSNLVTLLMRHGADVNACDSKERSILAYAVRSLHPDVVRLLLIEGADGCKVDSNGNTAVSEARNIHNERRGNAENQRNITEILQILANTPDRITGMTTFMTAAKKGDYETAEILARYISNRDVDVRVGGNLALENGHIWAARQLYKMLHPQVSNVNFILKYEGFQCKHYVSNNQFYLDVDRQKMDLELAMKYLYLVSQYLVCFKGKSKGQFGDLSLNIKFTNEQGIDAGGLTAEFITLLFTTLFTGEHPFSLFTKSENGTYLLGFEEENSSFTDRDSRRCKDLGVLLAAIFSGFPERSEGRHCKIPTIFPSHFYKQLFAVYKYAVNNGLSLFKDMSHDNKEVFVKLVSDNDQNNGHYKNIDHNFEKQSYDDREISQILYFIIIDYMECKEEDKAIYSALQDLLEQSLAIPDDPIKLIHMQLDAERNDQYDDLNMQLRSTLRALLTENTFSADLKKRFIASREERYAHVCTALAMIGQGFIHADQDFIAVMMNQFERDPLTATEKLAICIQGEPITHETFVKLLKRSIVDGEIELDDRTAIKQRLAWLTEWCETGVYSMDGGQERRATIEEIKAVLHCVTGSSTITDQIFLTFAQAVNGMSEFHTCTHTVNFGSLALQHRDKVAFIEAWMNHVHSALDSGGFTIV